MTPNTPNRKGPMRGRYVTELTAAAGAMTKEFFGIPWRQILRDDKTTQPARARRWAAWWLYRQGLSLREVGRIMNRDYKAIQRMIAKANWEDEHGRINSAAVVEMAGSEIGDWRRA